MRVDGRWLIVEMEGLGENWDLGAGTLNRVQGLLHAADGMEARKAFLLKHDIDGSSRYVL